MEYGKTILQYGLSERKHIRDKLKHVRELMIKQRQHSYNLFIKPYDDRLKAIDDFSKNKISSNQYLTMVAEINNYIKKVFKEIKKESEE